MRLSQRLTNVEREKITDTMLQIKSARSSFDQVENSKVPHGDEIDDCLETAQHNLQRALGYAGNDPSRQG
jgi:hypothetical protein